MLECEQGAVEPRRTAESMAREPKPSQREQVERKRCEGKLRLDAARDHPAHDQGPVGAVGEADHRGNRGIQRTRGMPPAGWVEQSLAGIQRCAMHFCLCKQRKPHQVGVQYVVDAGQVTVFVRVKVGRLRRVEYEELLVAVPLHDQRVAAKPVEVQIGEVDTRSGYVDVGLRQSQQHGPESTAGGICPARKGILEPVRPCKDGVRVHVRQQFRKDPGYRAFPQERYLAGARRALDTVHHIGHFHRA